MRVRRTARPVMAAVRRTAEPAAREAMSHSSLLPWWLACCRCPAPACLPAPRRRVLLRAQGGAVPDRTDRIMKQAAVRALKRVFIMCDLDKVCVCARASMWPGCV